MANEKAEELLPPQPVGTGHMAHIYVVERGPEPGWSGNTVHFRIRVIHRASAALHEELTFGPLHGNPLETGLTDDDAVELTARLEEFDRRFRNPQT